MFKGNISYNIACERERDIYIYIRICQYVLRDKCGKHRGI